MTEKTKEAIANVFKGIIIVLVAIIFHFFLSQDLYEPISALLRQYSRTITVSILGIIVAATCVKLFGGILDEDQEGSAKINFPSIIIILVILVLTVLRISQIW